MFFIFKDLLLQPDLQQVLKNGQKALFLPLVCREKTGILQNSSFFTTLSENSFLTGCFGWFSKTRLSPGTSFDGQR